MVSSPSLQRLARELQEIFAVRLQSLVVYGQHAHAPRSDGQAGGSHAHERQLIHTLAVVEGLTAEDLRACAGRVASWHDNGLATPLVLAAHEFERALDAFPFEFGDILSDHELVAGTSPFEGLNVDSAELRHACEVHARSHLLHLREGYLETRGRPDALAVLVVRSAAPFAALVAAVARLEGHPSSDAATAARHTERVLALPDTIVSEIVALSGVHEITSAEAERLFPPYLDAVGRLVQHVDAWRAK